MAPRNAPEGWHTVTPRLIVADVAGQVRFLKAVFGATGDVKNDAPCEMRIGDSMVMVSGTGVRDAIASCLYVYVDDADASYRRAIDAGAETIEEPLDTPYGDRRAVVRDTAGNIWQIATRTSAR